MLLLPGNLTIQQHNETDYMIAMDLGTILHMRIDNKTIYLLESSPGVEFAEFRDNKIYIKVKGGGVEGKSTNI